MEKQYQSRNFSKNVDSDPLLEVQASDKADLKQLKSVSDKFREQLLLELQKVDFFYNENINKSIRPKIKEIKEQISHSIKVNEFRVHSDTFEMAIKEAYKDIHLIHQFIETNLEIKDKALNKYKKYFSIFSNNQSKEKKMNDNEIIMEDDQENDENEDNNNDEVESIISNFISFKSSIGGAKDTFESLKEELTQLFIDNYSYKYKSKTEKVLKKCVQNKDFTDFQSFYLGFFIGLLIFQLSIICIIAWYYDLDVDHDIEFKSIFPMFRGFFIVCLYWWMHGINTVYQ